MKKYFKNKKLHPFYFYLLITIIGFVITLLEIYLICDHGSIACFPMIGGLTLMISNIPTLLLLIIINEELILKLGPIIILMNSLFYLLLGSIFIREKNKN